MAAVKGSCSGGRLVVDTLLWPKVDTKKSEGKSSVCSFVCYGPRVNRPPGANKSGDGSFFAFVSHGFRRSHTKTCILGLDCGPSRSTDPRVA